MKYIDRLLERLRIQQALPYIPAKARVLDIGCGSSEIRKYLNQHSKYVGVDPKAPNPRNEDQTRILRAQFREGLVNEKFDVVLLLAVIEHIKPENWTSFSNGCYEALEAGGLLIVTAPSPKVDNILHFLRFLRLIDGMELDEHYGFRPKNTFRVFEPQRFELETQKKFELGFNNLFVFRRTSNSRIHNPRFEE